MGVILFIVILVLLIFLGVFISVWLYRHGGLTTGHIRRILRYRAVKPLSPASEETVEEEVDEEEPL